MHKRAAETSYAPGGGGYEEAKAEFEAVRTRFAGSSLDSRL